MERSNTTPTFSSPSYRVPTTPVATLGTIGSVP